MAVRPIPEGYHSITPYLLIKGGAEALDFYARVFGATEIMRMSGPEGRVMHAEIRIGDSVVMLADEFPEEGFVGPHTLGGTPLALLFYVKDVDAAFGRAIANGARELKPVQNQFYGDRSGTLLDPFGHMWTISTRVEDLTTEELRQREEEFKKSFSTH